MMQTDNLLVSSKIENQIIEILKKPKNNIYVLERSELKYRAKGNPLMYIF